MSHTLLQAGVTNIKHVYVTYGLALCVLMDSSFWFDAIDCIY